MNIGSRQNKRERGFNVIDVDYSEKSINTAIFKCLKTKKVKKSKIYGDGKSGEKISKILEEIPLVFHKTITY